MVRLHRSEAPLQMDYLNVPQASSKEGTEAETGRNVYRLVAVSLGILCVLQAALNISLRLTSLYSVSEIDKFAACANSTLEKELKRKIYTIDQYGQEGWVYFRSSLYYVSSMRKTWHSSQLDCMRKDAHLVVVDSREEQEFLRKFNIMVWIGLRDRRGTWYWINGSQLKTSFWAPNEPNKYEGKEEECVQIRYNDNINNWNDVICDEQHFWICEKKV
ncbi:CD209 antigen-like protein E isoform X1 [Syngnathus typhle]|uniref:CD209 antigen-like protein E isoform X1 n=1 Tax=Syngnathus typhle TaxID=161592 RepID=UPI002A69984A|nr:CD209 antigen-like protein E isoform X1 [Syngnathus typhle]